MLTIKPNPNETIRETVSKAVKINNGYCPCKVEKTEDTKCICKEFREQTTPGKCHCGLFVKEQLNLNILEITDVSIKHKDSNETLLHLTQFQQ